MILILVLVYLGLQKSSFNKINQANQVRFIFQIKAWFWRSSKKLLFPCCLFLSFFACFWTGLLGMLQLTIICTLSEVSCPTPHFCWTSSSMFRLQVADVSKMTLFQDTSAYVHIILSYFIVVFDRSFTGIERRPLVSAEPELLGWLIFLWSDVRPSPDIMFNASGVWLIPEYRTNH